MRFILSKVIWVFTSPGNLLVLLLITGAFMMGAKNALVHRIGSRLTFTVALIFFLIAIFPVGTWSLAPLENIYPPQIPDKVDGIILIGGDERALASQVRGQPVFMDSGRRYLKFAELARKFPKAKLVFSGGSPAIRGPNTTLMESDIAKQVLESIGVPVERMTIESTSRNTHENAINSFNIVHPSPDQTWLLVTSAVHMPRALSTFRKVGWHILPATTGYQTAGKYPIHLNFDFSQHLTDMSWAAHEYYGLLAYWLMGYTDKLWPH